MKLIFLGMIFLVIACRGDHFLPPDKAYTSESISFIDSFEVDLRNSSHQISGTTSENRIFLYDRMIGWIREYTLKGMLIDEFGEIAQGPNSFKDELRLVIKLNDGFFIQDRAWNYYFLDSNKTIIDKGKYNFYTQIKNNQVDWTANGDNPSIYELLFYATEDARLIQDNRTLILPINTENPDLNAYYHKEYYKQSRVIGLLDTRTGDVNKVIITRPDSYNDGKHYPNFLDFSFSVSTNNTLLMTFAIDHFIYEFNLKGETKNIFGVSGKGMKTDYRQPHSFEDAEDHILDDWQRYGYYKDLTAYKKGNDEIILRSYQKGSDNSLYLQVYVNRQIEKEIVLPYRFKIIGCIDGICYGMTINPDEEFNKIYIYSFNPYEKI